MKILSKYYLFLILTISLVSCSDYLDINTDPNNPTADVVGPELILPAAQNGSFSALSGNQNRLGNIMANQWAGDITNFTSGNEDEYRFNFTATFYTSIWNNMYLVTDKLQAVINKDSEINAYYTAIGKILKAHNMQYIVDLYGDCPYSEAFQRGTNYQPAYDSALSVYESMYAELEDATALIDGATSNAVNPGSSDVMLGGNMDMWVKFANTLKLKLLIRATSSTDGDAQTFVNSKWPSLASADFLNSGENITINPGYVEELNKQNPFWNSYGFDATGNRTQNNKFFVGSQYFIEYLKASGNVSPIASFDSRISAYFTTASGSGGNYQGVIQGADDPENPDIGLSYIGSGLLVSAEQDGLFFTASESLLLQAEAVLKGKLTGNAQGLFESAIENSFNDYNLDSASYISGITGLSGIGWTGSTNADLAAVARQKWVVLHSIDGAENYIEYSRTGVPNLPLPLIAQKPHRPYRMMYPSSEISGNTSNVPSISQTELFSPSIFWQN
jgi:hypothetical protein